MPARRLPAFLSLCCLGLAVPALAATAAPADPPAAAAAETAKEETAPPPWS